jgi:putative pyruvate formate lyase activating enzyme
MAAASYIALHESGELARRAEQARELLSPCRVCPRECLADRLSGDLGDCNTGELARVSSVNPHFGEEDVLVGRRGSGTVFFCGCNLNCDFCQNCEISQFPGGREVDAGQLAKIFLSVQEMGCHNLNTVTPTHVTPQILAALDIAAGMGLRLPWVYNCGGYESVETLKLLDSVVDVYMPDLKFTDPDPARRFCRAGDYPEIARAALSEMHRQVGDLQTDDEGVATRGLLVRHLVMPADLAGSRAAARFLASLSKDTFVNVMAQYRPCHRADRHEDIRRPIDSKEHQAAVEAMRAEGLTRLDGVSPRRIRFFFVPR